MGQKMMGSVAGFEAVDAKTFKMKMKEPYGLVLQSLGKPSSNVPFMMPKKTAETDPMQQIKVEDVIGSGSVRVRRQRMEAGRESRLRQESRPTSRARSRPPAWPAAR